MNNKMNNNTNSNKNKISLNFLILIFLISFNLQNCDFNILEHGENDSVLKEAGNDAFGTIQEVINKLVEDKDTDWSTVNIESLRLHLLEMNDMTLNVEVVSQTPIENGLEAIVMPTTPRAKESLINVFSAHPMQLKEETGWIMEVERQDNRYILKITTTNKEEIEKIRALGYIGIMAYGLHHQPHHWAIATGKNPHDGSHSH